MLAILGASGHGKVLAEIAELTGWENVVFFDDAWPDKKVNGSWSVIGNTEQLLNNSRYYQGVIVAIGDNNIRQQKLKKLASSKAKIITLIHPSAVISKYSKIGPGSVVVAGAVINPDCIIGDAVHICPGARLAGGIKINERAWIGIGSSVRQLITIGSDGVVGAGAAVVKNVLSNTTVVGIPATPL